MKKNIGKTTIKPPNTLYHLGIIQSWANFILILSWILGGIIALSGFVGLMILIISMPLLLLALPVFGIVIGLLASYVIAFGTFIKSMLYSYTDLVAFNKYLADCKKQEITDKVKAAAEAKAQAEAEAETKADDTTPEV